MNDNFWNGFEKRAFLGAAVKGVLGTGARSAGTAIRQGAANWGSGARTGMQAMGDVGRGVWGAAKTTAQALKPHLNVAGQAVAAQARQMKQRFQQPKPPVM